jgi:hypothetical protein
MSATRNGDCLSRAEMILYGMLVQFFQTNPQLCAFQHIWNGRRSNMVFRDQWEEARFHFETGGHVCTSGKAAAQVISFRS